MTDEVESLREENRRLHTKLEDLERRADLVNQVSEEGVWDWNLQTGEAYFSRQLLKGLGYDEDEFEETGEAFFALLHPDDAPRVQEKITAHFERREPYVADFRMRAKDGGWLEVQARGQAEWDAEGKPKRMAGVQIDVTEIRLRERERLRNEELIAIQTETIRALGVPILQVWKGILCLPIIGAVDEERAATVTAELLDRVVATSARFVVLDLTGAEFRGQTAQYLANVTRSLRLIGSTGVLCGISPRTAQILVDLVIGFDEVTTYRDLGDALRACLLELQSDS
jgi:PAS domain S-box-containing protein